MQNSRLHPLFIAAAVAVIITCGVAIASMTGLWPNSKAAPAESLTAGSPLATETTDANNTLANLENITPLEAKPVSTALDAQTQTSNATPARTAPKEAHKMSSNSHQASGNKIHTQEYHSKPKAKPQEPEFAPYERADAPPVAKPVDICRSCGRVVDVRPIRIEPEGSGVGAVAGGVAGALLGKQLGNGNGQKALTVAGAVGGALLGNKIEKDRRASTVYDVVVEFEDGSSQTFREGSSAGFQVGDRVRASDGQLTLR